MQIIGCILLGLGIGGCCCQTPSSDASSGKAAPVATSESVKRCGAGDRCYVRNDSGSAAPFFKSEASWDAAVKAAGKHDEETFAKLIMLDGFGAENGTYIRVSRCTVMSEGCFAVVTEGKQKGKSGWVSRALIFRAATQ